MAPPLPSTVALALVYCTVFAILADVPQRLPMSLRVCVVWCGVVCVDLRLTLASLGWTGHGEVERVGRVTEAEHRVCCGRCIGCDGIINIVRNE